MRFCKFKLYLIIHIAIYSEARSVKALPGLANIDEEYNEDGTLKLTRIHTGLLLSSIFLILIFPINLF